MKVKGALWKQFYNDEDYWKEHFHDDTLITFDGVEQEDYNNPEDDAVVEVESGYVYKGSYEDTLSLVTFYRRWYKMQSTTVIVVTVEKDYAESAKAEIKQLEGVKGVK